jgi:hypothetical protein
MYAIFLLFSFYSLNLIAKELKYSQTRLLREQHKTTAGIELGFKFEKVQVNVKSLASTLIEINNPVFPEIDLLLVRSDILSVKRNIQYNSIDISPQLSLFNRWYNDRVYSLEHLITGEIDLEIKNGKTYTPVYLDLLLERKKDKIVFWSQATGFELFNTDPYEYNEIEVGARINSSTDLRYGFFFSPIYRGDYSFISTLGVEGKYSFSRYFSFDTKISSNYKQAYMTVEAKYLFLQIGLERSVFSRYSSVEIDNVFFNMHVRY